MATSFKATSGGDGILEVDDIICGGSSVNSIKAETATTMTNVVTGYGADNTGVIDATTAIQAAIDAIDTTEYTESVPTQGALGEVFLPAGRYKVSAKINVPSYINIVGTGRNTTIIDSYITNGDPVFLVKNISNVQQFYNTLQGFTINGRLQACQGIQIYKTSRWVLRDVMIDRTLGEGLYIYESYLGEIYSTLVRACGDATHFSVSLSGPNASGGSHAVSFFGGEINGGSSAVNGVYLKYGTSVLFSGTTIEGFASGIGFSNENGNSLVVDGCYFEGNKEDIVETNATLGTNYVGNYFGTLTAGGRGHLGIYYAQGSKIEGNFFTGTSTVKIFDSTGTSTGKLHMSSVRANYAPTFPINIDASLITSAKATGTVIETYDGSSGGSTSVYGVHSFQDDLRPISGIGTLNNLNVVVKAGTGSPEGVVTATRGIYIDVAGTTDATLWVKKSGTNSNTGWLAMQDIHITSTASRPAAPTQTGWMIWNFTKLYPEWWNGVGYVNADNASASKWGTGAILSGTTSIAITHALGTTPTNITVTPHGNVGHFWVSSIGSTTFTINCETAPGADVPVSWNAKKE